MAITLVSRADKGVLDRAVKFYKLPIIERTLPTDEEVEAVVAERLTALLEARLRDRDKLQAERSQRFARLARSLMESDEGVAILTMLLDDTYQQALHAPVAPPEPLPPPVRRVEQPERRAEPPDRRPRKRSRRRR